MPTTHANTRHLLRAVVGAVVLGAIVLLMFLGALHSPEPNDVEVALVGPKEVTTGVAEHIDEEAPGAFEFHYLDDEGTAREEVLQQEVTAAFIPGETSAQLLVAGASGALSRSALTTIFTAAAEANGAALAVEDLAPPGSGDRAGLSAFLLTIGTLLPSLILAVLLAVSVGRGVSPGSRAGAAALGSSLLGLTGAIVVDPVLGALEGSFWSLFGMLWLFSFAVAGAALALHRLLGVAGLGLVFLLFLVAGMPTAGGAVGPNFIPEGFQVFTLATPAGEAVPLIRKLVYFDAASISLELGLLATWAVVAAVVLLLPGRRTQAPDAERDAAAPSA